MKLKKGSLQLLFLTLLVALVSVFGMLVSGNLREYNLNSDGIRNRIIQAKLSSLGYYTADINGIYDNNTTKAVISFQSDNNLDLTGTVDDATSVALGVSSSEQTNNDLYLLAKLIHSEARGEPYTGQVAVGAVVLNRVKDAGFPNTLQGVIYQPWAFTALHDGQFNLEPNATAYQAAQDAMNGWDPSYGSLYYYNPATATSSWIFTRTTVVVIGNHVFAI